MIKLSIMKRLALYAEVFSTVVASINAVFQKWDVACFFMLFSILFSIVYLRQNMIKEE